MLAGGHIESPEVTKTRRRLGEVDEELSEVEESRSGLVGGCGRPSKIC